MTNNSVNSLPSNSSAEAVPKSKSFLRCPKCRSINPLDAKYCQQCGKVFSSKKPESK